MKRRDFFRSLFVAPVALAVPKPDVPTSNSVLFPVGVAGHDISKGSVIYGNKFYNNRLANGLVTVDGMKNGDTFFIPGGTYTKR